MTISFSEFIHGFKRSVKHLNGKSIDIEIGPGEINNSVYLKKLKGWGMPIPDSWNSYGDLYARIIVDLPSKLTQE